MFRFLAVVAFALTLGGCVFESNLGTLPTLDVAPADLQAPSAACITLDPPVLDFGTAEEGDVVWREASLLNQCDLPFALEGLTLGGDAFFELEAAPFSPEGTTPGTFTEPKTVLPGQEFKIQVAFRPLQEAMARGTLSFDAVDPSLDLPPLDLLGNGNGPCLELESEMLDFGCQIVGTTVWRTLGLSTCAKIPLTIESIEWAEESSPRFVLNSGEFPRVVGPGGSAAITVGYTPFVKFDSVAPNWDTAKLEVRVAGYAQAIEVPVRGFPKNFSCEGLRVVLVWVTPGDPNSKDQGLEAGSDMDLHLKHPFAVDYFDIPFDVFWYNAKPQWGPVENPATDPVLSLDDYDGLGPESIVLPLPQEDTIYTVGVHYWSDHKYGPASAQIQIFIFGELAYESPLVELVRGQLWDVARLHWPSGEVEVFGEGDGPVIHTDFPKPCDVIYCGK